MGIRHFAVNPNGQLRLTAAFAGRALDTLLPPRCVLCGQACGARCLCAACHRELPWTGPGCRRCGTSLGSEFDEACGGCTRRPPPFDRTVCPLYYTFPANRLVQNFKFGRGHAAGRVLAFTMAERLAGCDPPDLLVPVPLHTARLARRGFNQAYELARHLGGALGVPLAGADLRRTRNTAAQSGLSRAQRRRNLRHAFRWRGGDLSDRHVALVDDVMTTGTTLAECARVLKDAGAKRVDNWVATRATPG